MAKTQEPMQEKILLQSMDDVMHNSMLPYAEHVILERALPRVEDGLKPVQRRILFTMMELGLSPDRPHRKSARIVGDCLGKYHPHGDSSVYDAMVRMAQPFAMRAPLVDGHGNFGSIDGDSAAAMRYTEARMTDAAMQQLRDIDKETVPFTFNFDDTLKEPELLPGRFPNLLVNGASGIAVGLATNIPPHNPAEAIDAVIAMMENLQRENLHYMEEAEGYQNLIRDHGLSQDELARRLGKNQSKIANKMRILKLPLTVKRMLLQYNLTERHARALLRLHDEEMQIKIVNVIVQQNLNVKATEDLVERTLSRMYGIEAEEPTNTGKISGFVRDTRLFVNSIKTVVRQMSDAGLAPKFDSSESDGGLEIRVWIPHLPAK